MNSTVRRIAFHFDRIVALFACLTFVEWNIVLTISRRVPWFAVAALLMMPLCLAAMLQLQKRLGLGIGLTSRRARAAWRTRRNT
jgi:hypothetical protein